MLNCILFQRTVEDLMLQMMLKYPLFCHMNDRIAVLEKITISPASLDAKAAFIIGHQVDFWKTSFELKLGPFQNNGCDGIGANSYMLNCATLG
ncbi:hypothetical protein SUGI_1042900 [Cryptomeria japonica]|nr:hypothetical protein SUGI_1042900 [Cryptomeria japonica]